MSTIGVGLLHPCARVVSCGPHAEPGAMGAKVVSSTLCFVFVSYFVALAVALFCSPGEHFVFYFVFVFHFVYL